MARPRDENYVDIRHCLWPLNLGIKSFDVLEPSDFERALFPYIFDSLRLQSRIRHNLNWFAIIWTILLVIDAPKVAEECQATEERVIRPQPLEDCERDSTADS